MNYGNNGNNGVSPNGFTYPLTPLEAHYEKHQAQTRADCDRMHSEFMARANARDAEDRQRKYAVEDAKRQHDYARQLQQDRFEQERKLRQMDLDAQRRGWGR